jgi:threonyl-tRNA synthetase
MSDSERDHRTIGQELGLFVVSDLIGKGLPMLLPKGAIIREELENLIKDEKRALGYKFV